MSDNSRSQPSKTRYSVVQELAERRLDFLFKVSTPILVYYEVRAYFAGQFYSTIINSVGLAILLVGLWVFYRRKNFELASSIYIAGLITVVGVSPLVDQQMHSPTMWLLTLVPIIAAHLRGASAAIRLAILGVFIMAGIWVSTTIADIPPEYPSTVFDRSLLRCFAVLVAAGLGLSAQKAAEKQFQALEEQSESLKASQTALEAARNAKSSFLANMSHEIRTPLNGMLGMAQFLQAQTHSPEHSKCIDQIHRNGERLLGILDDVLNLSKLEAGRYCSLDAPFELKELQARLEESYEGRAANQKPALRFDIKGGDFAAVSDMSQIAQATKKVIDNALHHSGGSLVRVQLEAKSLDEKPERCELVVRVTDDGHGIEPQIARSIQNHRALEEQSGDPMQGAGLGLPLAIRLAHHLGGQLELKPTNEEGSCFELRFELAIDREHRSQSLENIDASARYPIDVLVVDDVQINRIIVERQLKLRGCRVVQVESGAQALQQLQERSFDLALVDIHMPKMDGYELSRIIRSQYPKQRNMAIIALSAGQRSSYLDKCLAAGMDDMLSKPFTAAELGRLLAKYGSTALETAS